MKFDHTIVVDAPVERVAALLDDAPAVANLVPGVEDTALIEPGVLEGKLRVRLGPLGLAIAGRARVERGAEDTWRLVGEGRDGRVGAGAQATLEARVVPRDAGGTEVAVTADVQLSGRLAELGQPLIRRKADALVGDFAENLRRALS